jgi:hypothetical protein
MPRQVPWLCLCYHQFAPILSRDGRKARCTETVRASIPGAAWASSRPLRGVVQSIGGVVRSTNRTTRSTRQRHQTEDRPSREPRRTHSRRHRWAVRQRRRHQDHRFRTRASSPYRPPFPPLTAICRSGRSLADAFSCASPVMSAGTSLPLGIYFHTFRGLRRRPSARAESDGVVCDASGLSAVRNRTVGCERLAESISIAGSYLPTIS